MSGSSRGPRPRLEVFAVGDRDAQLIWRHLDAGRHDVAVGSSVVSIYIDGPPSTRLGSVLVTDLEPATTSPIGLDDVTVGTLRTVSPPPGSVRCRIATISDLHIGERDFGHLPRVRDNTAELHGITCLRAALTEISAWGADLLVIKGDLTHHNRHHEYAQLVDLLADVQIPIVAIPGNHDMTRASSRTHLHGDLGSLREHGVTVVDDALAIDMPGVTVVAANTVRHGRSIGGLDHLGAILDAANRSEPVLMAIHHQLMPWLNYWPPGMIGLNAHRLLREVHAVNQRVLITGGHTHRHRRWHWRSLVVTEVGSPKDHPGTWAGYAVHDGGIRQVVYRVGHPDALAWTERTAATVLGRWGRWSPGRLDDRCFTHTWR